MATRATIPSCSSGGVCIRISRPSHAADATGGSLLPMLTPPPPGVGIGVKNCYHSRNSIRGSEKRTKGRQQQWHSSELMLAAATSRGASSLHFSPHLVITTHQNPPFCNMTAPSPQDSEALHPTNSHSSFVQSMWLCTSSTIPGRACNFQNYRRWNSSSQRGVAVSRRLTLKVCFGWRDQWAMWHRNWNSAFRVGNNGWVVSTTARADAQSLEEAAVPLVSSSWEGSSSSSTSSASPSSSAVDELSGSEAIEEVLASSSGSLPLDSKQQPAKGGVFPGGVRRREVRIPGLVLRIQVMEVLQEGKGSEGFLGDLSSAVAEGLTMVILESSGVEGEGGARLYEAACMLKSVLRGRAELLVAERVDIAAAAGADGVVLSDEGLPAVVARRMMQSTASEAGVLPLVARTVSSTQSAKSATALEGADLLLLQCSDVGELTSYVKGVCEEVSIPVFLDVAGLQSSSEGMVLGPALDLLQNGASGLVLSATQVMENDNVSQYVAAVFSAINLAVQQQNDTEIQGLKESLTGFLGQDTQDGPLPNSAKNLDLAIDLDLQAKLILEEERTLLTTMVEFVQAASPEMEEISLLIDAVKQLDELFLLVIVGEFNSGKSSVINALLGKKFLKEGVLPTTNEITVLRHSGDGYEGEERSEKHPDGHFLRYIPAELLKQMNLVDTPGTNVILQRQQRLTEEFVPRADLVLFVLSVDRALTESEVTFLRYIRQWGKKIIFILNKSDVVSERTELEEVVSFVKENAQSLLSVEQAIVYPVSARRAILAKLAATNESGVVDQEVLQQDSYWKSSGFGELEDFIYSFLGGSSDAGAERLRLKLDTPLGIGMALLGACDRQLSADIVKAETDLRVLAQIDEQLNQYQQAIEADATLQRQQSTEVIATAKIRAGKFVDSLLRLSNIEATLKFLLGSDGIRSMPESRGFNKQVIGSAVSDIQRILEEHAAWLTSNTARQMNMYGELVTSRWPDVIPGSKMGTENGSQLSSSLESFKDKREKTDSKSIAVLEGFDIKAAELLLEQEIREVVFNVADFFNTFQEKASMNSMKHSLKKLPLKTPSFRGLFENKNIHFILWANSYDVRHAPQVLGTYGGFGIAGASASVLTSVLPTTLEDLVALGVCTAGGFVGVWNLPSRRRDVKNKVNNVADGIARRLSQAMQEELEQNLDQLGADMRALTAPYRIAAEAERNRVTGFQKQLEELDSEFRALRQKVQNLGT